MEGFEPLFRRCFGVLKVSKSQTKPLLRGAQVFFMIGIWVFPKIGVGWFIIQNPIKMDDFGGNTPIFGNIHIL